MLLVALEQRERGSRGSSGSRGYGSFRQLRARAPVAYCRWFNTEHTDNGGGHGGPQVHLHLIFGAWRSALSTAFSKPRGKSFFRKRVLRTNGVPTQQDPRRSASSVRSAFSLLKGTRRPKGARPASDHPAFDQQAVIRNPRCLLTSARIAVASCTCRESSSPVNPRSTDTNPSCRVTE